MANTKISALTALTNPTGSEEFVYAYNNTNGKVTLNTMKSFIAWWGGGITTLNADANIWELAEWFYETAYDLFYKAWEKVDSYYGSIDPTYKQMLFVTEESSWTRAYLVFSANHSDTPSSAAYAWFWYSASSSDWEYRSLDRWDKSLRRFGYLVDATWANVIDSLNQYSITQVVKNLLNWTHQLKIWSNPWKWVTYSIYVDSVASGATYDITLWTWVTNPFGITLPTNSNKKCLITVLITGASEWIVTSCTIES